MSYVLFKGFTNSARWNSLTPFGVGSTRNGCALGLRRSGLGMLEKPAANGLCQNPVEK